MNKAMDIRDKVIEHAEACRRAVDRGEVRPEWTRGSLRGAYLCDADLRAAVLRGVALRGAVLCDAKLAGADLRDADLRGALLRRADLRGADLRGADLRGANLCGAYLRGGGLRAVVLPDGRTLDEWQADPLAGLCDDPKSVSRAIAAWGGRTWEDCPLHAALGANSLADVPGGRRALAATFVALLDGEHLPRPPDRNL